MPDTNGDMEMESCEEYTKKNLSEILNYFRTGGLNSIPFGRINELNIEKCDSRNVEVRYWLGLAYLLGTDQVEKNVKKAWEVLAPNCEFDERLSFCYGYAYLNGLGVELSLERAVKWLEMACKEPNCTSLYYCGECYRLMAESMRNENPHAFDFTEEEEYDISDYEAIDDDLDLPINDSEFSVARNSVGELYSEAMLRYLHAAELGCAEAYYWAGRCLRDVPSASGVVFHRRVGSVRRDSEYFQLAAENGLAEGWTPGFGSHKVCSPNRNIAKSEDCLYDAMKTEWLYSCNVSRAYYLANRLTIDDALVYYIKGVVHECGLCCLKRDGKAARTQFNAAIEASSDRLGYVKWLAQEHLTHVCSMKRYDFNFAGHSLSIEDAPSAAIKYFEYMVAASEAEFDFNYDFEEGKRDWRCCIWWYRIRLAYAIHDFREKAKILTGGRWHAKSPDAAFLMSHYELLRHTLDVQSEVARNNREKWLKMAADEGSVDALLSLAHLYQGIKRGRIFLRKKGDFGGFGCWYSYVDDEYDKKIIEKLREAYGFGCLDAGYELGMCARYGKDIVDMSSEEAFALFKKNSEMGHRESLYEYAFCLYDGYGVEKNIELAKMGISSAARADYGRGRCLYDTLFGFTYWDDYDRGIQEL